jgi:hypothetical protein
VDRTERRRLRLRLALFFVALALPSALLLFKALDQLKWEALRQSQLAAEALTLGIDERLGALIREQDERSFADFAFLTLAGDPSAGFVQRSVLSAFPVDSVLPGLIGWFQIDAAGRLSTPLLPAAGLDAGAYGIDAAELVVVRRWSSASAPYWAATRWWSDRRSRAPCRTQREPQNQRPRRQRRVHHGHGRPPRTRCKSAPPRAGHRRGRIRCASEAGRSGRRTGEEPGDLRAAVDGTRAGAR